MTTHTFTGGDGVESHHATSYTRESRCVESIKRRDLALLVAFAAATRLIFSWGPPVFHLSPDEFAVAGMAKHMSGTGTWNMLVANTWQPGLSALLAPIYWLGLSPQSFIRVALVVNALLGGAAAIPLVAITRRLTLLPRFGVLLTCAILMSATASLSASAYLWAEPLVTLSFLTALWFVLRTFDGNQAWAPIAAVVAALAGYASHGRMLPFLILVTVGVVTGAVRSAHVASAATSLMGALLGGVAIRAWSNALFAELWEVQGGENTARAVLDRMADPTAVLESVAGQIWYLLVSTIGLFGLGVYALSQRLRPDQPANRRRDAALVLYLTVPMLIVSMVFTSGRTRGDYHIYGRYNDAIIGPILVMAIAWLVLDASQTTRRTWTWLTAVILVLTVELGLLVHLAHGKSIASATLVPMVPGLQFITNSNGGFEVLVATTVGASLQLLLMILARRWHGHWFAAPSFVFAFVIVSVILSHNGVVERLDSTTVGSELEALQRDQLQPGEPVYISLIPEQFFPSVPPSVQRDRALLYQWHIDQHPFQILTVEVDEPGIAVFGTEDDPYLSSLGSTIVWRDPELPMALWRLGGE